MKDLKNLKGAKTISKNEQMKIKGGGTPCINGRLCLYPLVCVDGFCVGEMP
ncbi:MAG: hypothetical protein GQ557_01490 [Mycoplasmataceae bacterium]|nr:hypothetical protein [Mycoplasmataceae bacterium]